MAKQKRSKKKRNPRRMPPQKRTAGTMPISEDKEIRFSYETEDFCSECIVGFGNIDIPLDIEEGCL